MTREPYDREQAIHDVSCPYCTITDAEYLRAVDFLDSIDDEVADDDDC